MKGALYEKSRNSFFFVIFSTSSLTLGRDGNGVWMHGAWASWRAWNHCSIGRYAGDSSFSSSFSWESVLRRIPRSEKVWRDSEYSRASQVLRASIWRFGTFEWWFVCGVRYWSHQKNDARRFFFRVFYEKIRGKGYAHPAFVLLTPVLFWFSENLLSTQKPRPVWT